MAMMTLYVRQQKRHRCIEQSFGLCGRGRGWDDLGEWHWNMYNIICEHNHQSKFDAWFRMLGAGALGWPRGMVWGWKWERGSGWGTHVHPSWIHVYVWQNQYKFDSWIGPPKPAAQGQPRGMGWNWWGAQDFGTHVHPWLVHVYVWQKPLHYCKIISLQLK